jgi:hypothetical protein
LFTITCCRWNSCYFPNSKSKKYIVIKNAIIAKILISSGVGRDLIVYSCDRNKMSVVGLLLYIIILPTDLFTLVIRTMILSNYRSIDNYLMNLLFIISLMISWGVSVLGIVILLIRKILWGVRHQNYDKNKLH